MHVKYEHTLNLHDQRITLRTQRNSSLPSRKFITIKYKNLAPLKQNLH